MTKTHELKDALFILGFGIVGAIGTSIIVNYTPGVKNANPGTKSIIQLIGGGLVVVFIPSKGMWKVVKVAGLGAMFAGGLGAVERITKMKALAGPVGGGKGLSAREIAALQLRGGSGMPRLNRPVSVMNRPVSVMNRPTSVMNGGWEGRAGGWGSRGW